MAKRYINRPGGIVVALANGERRHLKYGDEVPELAPHVNAERFSDTVKRKPDPLPESEASEKLKRALNRDTGKTSAIPENYNELTVDEVVGLVQNSEDDDAALILLHEITTYGRQKVVDAASDSVREAVYSSLQREDESDASPYAEVSDESGSSGEDKDGYPDDFEKLKEIVAERGLTEKIEGQPSKKKLLAVLKADDEEKAKAASDSDSTEDDQTPPPAS